jgi:hypothetical protein
MKDSSKSEEKKVELFSETQSTRIVVVVVILYCVAIWLGPILDLLKK